MSDYGFILKLQTDSRPHQNVIIKKIKIPRYQIILEAGIPKPQTSEN